MAPDVQTVAVSRVDGGLTIVRIVETEYHVDGSIHKQYNITPEYIDAIIAKYNWQGGEAAVSWELVPNDYLTDDTDVTYRNAWVHKKGSKKPDHDMSKAREIQRVYLRKARMAEFCRLDNDYRIADEAGNIAEKQRIGRERQAFRDVTEDPRIEAASTVEELKALRLDVLLPEITKGEEYMDKLRVSPAINTTKEKANEK